MKEHKIPFIGTDAVESSWLSYQNKLTSAAASDVFTYGGLLDRVNSTGYETQLFVSGTVQMILEQKFSYDDLKFISNARLAQMTISDIDRLISLLEKLKKEIQKIPENGILAPPSYQSPRWGYSPYYRPMQSTIQPLNGWSASNEPDPQYTSTLSAGDPDGITINPNPGSLIEDNNNESENNNDKG